MWIYDETACMLLYKILVYCIWIHEMTCMCIYKKTCMWPYETIYLHVDLL
jgi:hypothetical protein